jgi:hypothetical protein
VRARWPRRHALAAGLRAGCGLPVGFRRPEGQGGPLVTVPWRALAVVPFPSVVGWAGRAAGDGVAASPIGLWLAACRRGGRVTSDAVARDLLMREREASSALASLGIRRRRGVREGAARRRAGDGAAWGELGTTGVGDDGGNDGGWTQELMAQAVEGRGGRQSSAYRTSLSVGRVPSLGRQSWLGPTWGERERVGGEMVGG